MMGYGEPKHQMEEKNYHLTYLMSLLAQFKNQAAVSSFQLLQECNEWCHMINRDNTLDLMIYLSYHTGFVQLL